MYLHKVINLNQFILSKLQIKEIPIELYKYVYVLYRYIFKIVMFLLFFNISHYRYTKISASLTVSGIYVNVAMREMPPSGSLDECKNNEIHGKIIKSQKVNITQQRGSEMVKATVFSRLP